MKTMGLFLLFWFFSCLAMAAECDNPGAPEQVRIYFSNGMNNEPEQIEDNLKELKGEIVLSSVLENRSKKEMLSGTVSRSLLPESD